METVSNFYNLLSDEIGSKYFPTVKYYRDNENYTRARHSIELFNNGCLTYRKLVNSISKECNDTKENISKIIDSRRSRS